MQNDHSHYVLYSIHWFQCSCVVRNAWQGMYHDNKVGFDKWIARTRRSSHFLL